MYAALPDMHDQKPVVELSGNEMLSELLGEHFMTMAGAVEVPIKQLSHRIRPAGNRLLIQKQRRGY